MNFEVTKSDRLTNLYGAVKDYADDAGAGWTGVITLTLKDGRVVGHEETRTHAPARYERVTETSNG